MALGSGQSLAGMTRGEAVAGSERLNSNDDIGGQSRVLFLREPSGKQPHQHQSHGDVDGCLHGADGNVLLIADFFPHVDSGQQDMTGEDADEGLDGGQEQGQDDP